MTAPWRKAVRDVWRERMRSVFVVVAIAVGIMAFLAVLASYAVLRRELNRGYLATNPASAVLVTDAIDDRLLASARARGVVAWLVVSGTLAVAASLGPALATSRRSIREAISYE